MARWKYILLCGALLAGTLRAADQPERKLLGRQDPPYSELASRNNLHGRVRLKIWIDPQGNVRRLEYIGGHPVLADSALQAVKHWKYEAAAKETTALVELKF